MHLTVSACFLIRFALQCRFYLYEPAHAQMRKKKRKVGGFFAFSWARVHKTTCAPVNITATCIIFSCGQIKYSGG